jgi:hypothetical protein
MNDLTELLTAATPILTGARADVVWSVGVLTLIGLLAHRTFGPMLREHLARASARQDRLVEVIERIATTQLLIQRDLVDLRSEVFEVRVGVATLKAKEPTHHDAPPPLPQ